MPFGVELWIHCVVTMVRNLRSSVTVGGDGEVGGAKTKKKRPPRRKYDRNEIRAAVEEYREGQKCVVKLTFKDLQAKYNIPASTIRGYFNKDPLGQKRFCAFSDGAKVCPGPPR